MKILPAFFLIPLCLFIYSCNNNSDEKVRPPEAVQEKNADTLKSGIIHMKSVGTVGGSEMERTIYFEDNGLRRRIETVAMTKENDKEIKTTNIKIIAGGYSISFDPEEKLGTKTPYKSGGSGEFDFKTLSPKTLEDYGIHKEGTEVIAGKLCDIYTETNSGNNNYKKRSSIWNGFLLHEVTSNDNFKYEYVADKVLENVPIQPYMFLVPDSIIVSDPASMMDSLQSTSTFLDTLKQKNKLQARKSHK